MAGNEGGPPLMGLKNLGALTNPCKQRLQQRGIWEATQQVQFDNQRQLHQQQQHQQQQRSTPSRSFFIPPKYNSDQIAVTLLCPEA
jgi:transcription initiation factor TFIID subunit TAF12